MKHLLALVVLGVSAFTTPQLLLLDNNAKRPPQPVTDFTLSQYMSGQFVIERSDRLPLVAALEKAAKDIDGKPTGAFLDSFSADHTLVIVQRKAVADEGLTVRLVTRLAQPRLVCEFVLTRNETSNRKTQRRLLEFAAYLAQ